jgi:hypothetical protein
MFKYEEKYGSMLNKNSASTYTEIHLMMTQWGSKHVVINIKVNNLCYYFYPNCCVGGYKYTVLKDTEQDATRKNRVTVGNGVFRSVRAKVL